MTFTAVDNKTKTITSCKWEYQYTGSGIGPPCVGGWGTGLSTTTTQSWGETIAGQYTVRLTVNYTPIGMPPKAPPPTIISKTVGVKAADGFTVVKGYGVSLVTGDGMPNPEKLEVDFQITCGGTDAGIQIVGLPQEWIYNKVSIVNGVSTKLADDTAWTPATAQQGQGLFYLSLNLIVDLKSTNVSPAIWAMINVGDNFYTFSQKMQFVWIDACGNTLASPLGSINFAR